MIINSAVKTLFKEIARQSLSYSNQPDKDRKYLRRLVQIYKNQLTEDEQVYILRLVLEAVTYKSIITDPDNILLIHNIKLRTYSYLFLLTCILVGVISVSFKMNDYLNEFLFVVQNILKILTF